MQPRRQATLLIRVLPTCRAPLCSGRVYKAKLRGEFIAVKEIDLGASEANRRTFLTVCARGCDGSNGCQ